LIFEKSFIESLERRIGSHKGWIDVKWMEMENNTASQFATHSSTIEAAGLPVVAAFGFMPGLLLGLRKG